jgi:hypothetical protein
LCNRRISGNKCSLGGQGEGGCQKLEGKLAKFDHGTSLFLDGSSNFRDERAKFRDERAKFRDERAKFRDERAKFRDERAKFRDERAKFRDERAKFRDERAKFRDEWAKFHDRLAKFREGSPKFSADFRAGTLVFSGLFGFQPKTRTTRDTASVMYEWSFSSMAVQARFRAATHGTMISEMRAASWSAVGEGWGHTPLLGKGKP